MTAATHKNESDKNLNLYQKLVQVRREVKYVQKGGKGYNFSYATESQILGAIRGKMDELNVFLECDMVSLDPVECVIIKDKTPSKIGGLKATFEFTWTNADKPEECIKKKVILQNIESGIEAVGGLLTYANRYFLYKFFSIPTDKEDPDAFENKVKKTFESNQEGQSEPSEKLISKEDVALIEKEIKEFIAPVDSGYLYRMLDALKLKSLSDASESLAVKIKKNIDSKKRQILKDELEPSSIQIC